MIKENNKEYRASINKLGYMFLVPLFIMISIFFIEIIISTKLPLWFNYGIFYSIFISGAAFSIKKIFNIENLNLIKLFIITSLFTIMSFYCYLSIYNK